jgi:type IV pilus assembly protein PilE
MVAKYRRETGFTLIELMFVVVIVAIVLTVALPAYQGQVIKTKRALGRAELIAVLGRQEQFFVNNRQYSSTLAGIGYADPYAINDEANDVATTDGDRIYTISLATVSATSFTVQAVPQLGQAKDKLCGTLQITSTGVKSESGSGTTDDCW